MSIQLTERAARQIRKQLDKRGSGLGLRLGVKKTGCSGFTYVVDYADALAESERAYDLHGVSVVVAEADLPLLDGVEVDYAREGLSEAFRFRNPNAKGTCGCGESFAV
jgi:iron-sulfur cluster assembly protein